MLQSVGAVLVLEGLRDDVLGKRDIAIFARPQSKREKLSGDLPQALRIIHGNAA